MTSQAQIEIGFWRDLLRQKGTPENFLAQRQEDWQDFATHLPELADFLKNAADRKEGDATPATKVLEVGCGLISPLEFSEGSAEITAIDPLVGAYQDLIDLHGRRVRYLQESGEAIAFEDGTFDAVVCINVIDHTPNANHMEQEMRRVLKTGGKLFFGVNFDQALSPAHYGLWNRECVDDLLKEGWNLVECRTDERAEHNQTRYWAVYEKV